MGVTTGEGDPVKRYSGNHCNNHLLDGETRTLMGPGSMVSPTVGETGHSYSYGQDSGVK